MILKNVIPANIFLLSGLKILRLNDSTQMSLKDYSNCHTKTPHPFPGLQRFIYCSYYLISMASQCCWVLISTFPPIQLRSVTPQREYNFLFPSFSRQYVLSEISCVKCGDFNVSANTAHCIYS